jgi:hypothetical protein
MGWRDLLQPENETVTSPWIGGRSLRSGSRTWSLDGKLPEEHGWKIFATSGRKAKLFAQTDPAPDLLKYPVCGYLVGDRLVADDASVDSDPAKIVSQSERVWLIEPGLDRFVRVSAGRMYEDGPLVYKCQEMPFGPENDVSQAYLDKKLSVDDVPGVVPALDAVFRMETWQRAEAERRRLEAERRRLEEEERRRLEERRAQLVEKLGDGAGRREMAQYDFGEAARAALAIGGAIYLDHRRAVHRAEMVVKFRLDRRRFECTCDAKTLQIVDAGICLTDHDTDERGDAYFTLESLPAVIREAERLEKLVVYRHVD